MSRLMVYYTKILVSASKNWRYTVVWRGKPACGAHAPPCLLDRRKSGAAVRAPATPSPTVLLTSYVVRISVAPESQCSNSIVATHC